MPKRVFFLCRHPDYAMDCMRSSLGLAVENMYAYCAFLDFTIATMDDYSRENLTWIREMEGEVYSNIDSDVKTHDLQSITLEELGQQLTDCDVIIPYGIAPENTPKNSAPAAPAEEPHSGKKIVHIYRTTPDKTTQTLASMVSKGTDSVSFDLNRDTPNYDKLVDLIFTADQTICWW